MLSESLNTKKLRAIAEINQILKTQNLKRFKIGKTDNCSERENAHRNDGYDTFKVVANCASIVEANDLEKLLISHYSQDSRIENIAPGGEGRSSKSEEYYIYIITRK